MHVVVPLDFRFHQTADGSIWTDTSFEYGFWLRYLDVFDGVRVVGRALHGHSAGANWKRVNGEGVVFHPMPHYLGPWQYLRRALDIRTAAGASFAEADAVILRVPAQVSNCVASHLFRNRHPYGVEVLGDPYEVFQRGSVNHPFRPLFRWWFTGQLRKQCLHASAVAYVAEYLQQRYPGGGRVFSLSDVDIPSVAIADNGALPAARTESPAKGVFRLITVASLAQMYKGIDVLIEALARCSASGLDFHLRVIGDGKHRAQLQSLAVAHSLDSRISFLGQLPAGETIRKELDCADLFVLPSRTEGLPRAMIEAMARGLPCIGSAVGGIPELLAAEDLVLPGNVAALAGKIGEVARDPVRLAAMSARNLAKAREYSESELRPRRRLFYGYVREVTENWIKRGMRGALP
jgi:glycosyltransferase involved in cell wall biosynthesis